MGREEDITWYTARSNERAVVVAAATSGGRPVDIIEELSADHRRIKLLFTELARSKPWRRPKIYLELRQTLSAHEAAEASVVYPAIGHAVVAGSSTAEVVAATKPILDQVHRNEQLLVDLNASVSDRVQFDRLAEALHQAVVEHTQVEERVVFPLLRALADPQMARSLATDYRKVRAAAPTRPHRHLPHGPPMDLALRPVLGRLDRQRDRVSLVLVSLRLGGGAWLAYGLFVYLLRPLLLAGVLAAVSRFGSVLPEGAS